MTTGKPPTVPITEPEARLYILGALLKAELRGRPAQWTPEEWWDRLRGCDARDKTVIVWRLAGGFAFREIGAQLGVSRARAEQYYLRAIQRARRFTTLTPDSF